MTGYMRRLGLYFLSFMLVVMLLPLHVFADEDKKEEKPKTEEKANDKKEEKKEDTTTSSGNDVSANSKSSSMITFFRESRTSIDAGTISPDEYIIYSVFLSNFYTPWVTTLKDIKDEDKLASEVSNKFFGSSGNKGEVQNLNTKVYDAIKGGLKKEDSPFKIKASKDAEKAISGKVLLEKMGSTGKQAIYNDGGKELQALNSSSVRSAWQILFGLSPAKFTGKNGLNGMVALYVDGTGNIWGSPEKGAEPDDFILVMPASLNPATFSFNSTYKLPMANVFSMGAAYKPTANPLTDAIKLEPYYNAMNYTSKQKNNDGVVQIQGIYSPFKFIGKTDDLIMKGTNTNPKTSYSKFMKEKASQAVDTSTANLLLSVNTKKALSDVDENLDDVVKSDKKVRLLRYLTETTRVELGNVSDAMYFFKNQNTSSATDKGAGDFSDDDAIVQATRLFTEGTSKVGASNQKYNMYSGANFQSPFIKFAVEYRSKKNAKAKKEYLEGKLVGKLSKKDKDYDKALKVIQDLLEKGELGKVDRVVFNKAITALNKSSGVNNSVYGMLVATKTGSYISDKPVLYPDGISTAVAPMLTSGDSLIALDSFRINRGGEFMGSIKNWWDKGFNKYTYSSVVETYLDKDNKLKAPISPGTSDVMTRGDAYTAEQANTLATLLLTTNTYYLFGVNKTFSSYLTGDKVGDKKGNYKLQTPIMNGVNNFAGIYWGYMVDLLQVKATNEKSKAWDDITSFSNPHLPDITFDTTGGDLDLNGTSTGVSSSDDKSLSDMANEITKQMYGLLNPKDHTTRMELMHATMTSFFLDTHRSITGSWSESQYTVSKSTNTTYSSVAGYINTPKLSDLPLTDWVLNDYVYLYLTLMIILFIVIVSMALVKARTIQESAILFFSGALLLLLPQYLVAGVITGTNKVADTLYSDKFDYWAIVQHQQSVKNLKTAENASSNKIDSVIVQTMENAKNVYSKDTSVQIKWMSPKKEDTFDSLFNGSVSQGLKQNSTVFRWLFNSQFNQEIYVYDDPLATYVYRPYNSIVGGAKDNYNTLINTPIVKSEVFEAVEQRMDNAEGVKVSGMDMFKKNYTNPINYDEESEKSVEQAKLFGQDSTTDVDESYRYWMMNNQDLLDAIFSDDYETNPGYSKSSNDEYYQNFSQATESPFYYFYDVIKARYTASDSRFKDSLLTSVMFTVSDSETDDQKIMGKTRDYLDMEGLFTYVVPYLNQSNNYVNEYIKRNGSSISTYNFENGKATKDVNNAEAQLQYEQDEKAKNNMKNVWKMYTPWVNQLYTLDVMNAKGTVADKRVRIGDSLNPLSYQEMGRDMIFSEADMRAKRYNYSDLTDVERRIQDMYNDITRDWYYLANYYDFDDEALASAAAMSATFNFNKHFSETRLIGESTEMYPQNYELKNFNYDAFMRLMLLNATGEPLNGSGDDDSDLYERILTKTSWWTGLVLILADFMGVFVIPALKVVILLMMLFLGIATILSTLLSPPDKVFKAVVKHVGIPIIVFFFSTIAFAWVIAYIMGDGLSGYVGSSTPTLGVTDPTLTLIFMLIADMAYIFALWIVFKQLLKGFKTQATVAFFSAVGNVASAGTNIIKSVTNRVTRSNNGYDNYNYDSKGGKPDLGGSGGTTLEGAVGGNNSKSNNSSSGVSSNGTTNSNAPSPKTPPKVDMSGMSSKMLAGREKMKEGSANLANKLSALSSFRKEPVKALKTLTRKVGDKRVDMKYSAVNSYDRMNSQVDSGMSRASQAYRTTRDSVNSKLKHGSGKAKDVLEKGFNKAYQAPVDMAQSTRRKIGDKVATVKSHYEGAEGASGVFRRTGELGVDAINRGTGYVRDQYKDANNHRKTSSYDNQINRINYETSKLRDILDDNSISESRRLKSEIRMSDLQARRESIHVMQTKLRG